ncbi:CPBP family intramembrane glutamic endopeptidase [Acetobacterium tundrae]|nr:type II CAAX endopeptidase family protein [Acetobacterium tundrae]
MLKNMKYRYLILGVIFTLALSLILFTLLRLGRPYVTSFAGTLSLYFFPIGWMLYHFKKYHLSFLEWLQPIKFKIRETIAAALFPELLGMGILLLITLGITFILPAGGFNELPETTTNWGLDFVSTVVLAPICEELIFRGFIFNKMLTRFSPSKAVIISSVIFGAMHLSTGISPTLVGMVLCVIFMKYGSLLPCIAIHGLHNLVVVWFKYFSLLSSDTSTEIIPTYMPPLLIMSVIFVIIGLVWLVLFFQKNWHYATEFMQQYYGDKDLLSNYTEKL